MPRGDGTGPMGMGCYWFGRRHGFGNMYGATGLSGWQRAARYQGAPTGEAPFAAPVMSPEQELAFLRNQSKYMEEDIAKSRKRITELEKESGK